LDEVTKPVVWTSRATKDLEKTAQSYIDFYGKEKALQLLTEIRKSTEILEKPNGKFAKIGAIDESFAHLKRKYRKLISHNCKITYRIGEQYIYIIRVFDTRQNPTKNK